MNNKRILLAGIIILLSFLFVLPAFSEEKNILWNNYETGMEKGLKEKKKIFLHFYTDWCIYCTVMENQTFIDASVISFLNDNFVSIKVNADLNRPISKQYGVRGYPDNYFLSTSGEKITSRAGFIPPEDLLNYLKFIHTESYKKMTMKAFIEKL